MHNNNKKNVFSLVENRIEEIFVFFLLGHLDVGHCTDYILTHTDTHTRTHIKTNDKINFTEIKISSVYININKNVSCLFGAHLSAGTS